MMKQFLIHPLTLFSCIILGALCGSFLPDFSLRIAPINSVYTALLQVCALPVMICAIVLSVGKIFHDKFRKFLTGFFGIAVFLMLLSALCGLAVSGLTQSVFSLNDAGRVTLSKLNLGEDECIHESFQELNLLSENSVVNDTGYSFMQYINEAIPKNIFQSLSENATLQIVLFFLIFSIMINFIDKQYADPILKAFEGISQAMNKFVSLLLVFLPFSLFIVMAHMFADGQTKELWQTTIGYILNIYLSNFLFLLLLFVYITYKTGLTILEHLRAVRNTFFVSVSTYNKSATFPVAIEEAIEKLHIDTDTVNVTMPVSATLFPTGKIIIAAAVCIYATQVYEVRLSAAMLLFVLFSCVVYGFSVTSANAAVSASLLTIILQPLGIPIDLMSLILIGTWQLYIGITTFTGIYTSIGIAAFCAGKKEQSK